MAEQWKTIPGYPRHMVSDLGNIKSLIVNRILKPGIKNGYCHVSLKGCGERKNLSVHRLVLLAFVGPSNLQVDHLNSNRSDNRLCNLEYVTNRENQVRASSGKKTLPTGVFFVPDVSKRPYRALMKYKKQRISIGFFETAELAGLAYQQKVKEYEIR